MEKGPLEGRAREPFAALLRSGGIRFAEAARFPRPALQARPPGPGLAAVTWQDGVMADRYRTPGGWTVEVVQLAAGERLRIRHHGYYVADVGNADDLARWIPADELVQLERDALMPEFVLR